MPNPTPKHPYLGLIAFLAVCYAAAGIGGAVTAPKIPTWYASLVKPSWNPPNWIFGPVWTVLYFLMAVAGWMVWRQGQARLPMAVFGIQLGLNVLWSCIFFGLQQPGWAFVELVALWMTIMATTALFWDRSRLAGILFVPYLAWVSFAGVLNLVVWWLNA